MPRKHREQECPLLFAVAVTVAATVAVAVSVTAAGTVAVAVDGGRVRGEVRCTPRPNRVEREND